MKRWLSPFIFLKIFLQLALKVALGVFKINVSSPSLKSFTSGMLGSGFVELKLYVFFSQRVSLDQGSRRRKSSIADFSRKF